MHVDAWTLDKPSSREWRRNNMQMWFNEEKGMTFSIIDRQKNLRKNVST